jgi:hypothetical protein
MMNNRYMQDIMKECINKASLLKNLPLPLYGIITPPSPSYLKRGCRRRGRYSKEGYYSSLWKREVRRDFIIKEILVYGEA